MYFIHCSNNGISDDNNFWTIINSGKGLEYTNDNVIFFFKFKVYKKNDVLRKIFDYVNVNSLPNDQLYYIVLFLLRPKNENENENEMDKDISYINDIVFGEHEGGETFLCKCFNDIYIKNKNNQSNFYEELLKLTKMYNIYNGKHKKLKDN